jgi:hypothetical protein
MCLLLWNCNSIRNKTQYLDLLIKSHDPLIVVLTETHLDPSVFDPELRLSDYDIFRRDRRSKGGGILVAVKRLKGIHTNSCLIDPQEEMLSVKLSIYGFCLCIIAYYRPPNSLSLNSLYTFLEQSTDGNIFLLGDFNFPDIKWNNTLSEIPSPTRELSRKFLQFTQEHSLSQLVNFPTHVKGNTLDLFLTNCDPRPSFKDGDTGFSDHTALTFDISFLLPAPATLPSSRPVRSVYNFSKADICGIRIGVKSLHDQLLTLEGHTTTNQLWEIFKLDTLKLVATYVPTIELRTKKYWLTRETKTIIAKKRRFFHTYRRYPTQHNLDRLKTLGNLAKRLTRRDYISFIDTHISQNLESGNSRPLFQLIARTKKGEKSSNVTQLHKCVSDLEIAHSFSENFQSVFTKDNGRIPPICNQFLLDSVPLQPDIAVSESGILALLKSLNHRKGTGPDNLSPGILKFLATYIAPLLSLIFKHSISTASVPDDWRAANVVPVFKKGDRKEPLNYRPISLTSVTCKVFEHIIAHEIRLFLDAHNLLAECQHGFRKKHSCESQLIHTLSDLAIFNNSNTQVDVIVLDFSKAFDTVSHVKLISKLKSYNVNPNLVSWIQNWLACRTFKVVVNGVSSLPTGVTSGVPQGSVLGPLLFLLYINDLPSVLNCQKTSIRLFADDAILYRPIYQASDSDLLQGQLLLVSQWADDWQLRFNTGKCTTTSMHPALFQSSYTLGDTPLASSNRFTYLGINVCHTLSFNAHIKQTLQKASGTLYMLMRALKNASCSAKRTSYFSICLPVLEYASEIWSPSMKYLIADLEKINRKAFRWAYTFRKFDSISSEMEKVNWPTLMSRRVEKDAKTLRKIKANQLSVDYHLFIQTNSAYNTRKGLIRHTINTEPMRLSFFNRTMSILCNSLIKGSF